MNQPSIITTYEASKKYGLSTSHLRLLLSRKTIQGRQAPISSTRNIWLIEEPSLRAYASQERKPGPKPTKKGG